MRTVANIILAARQLLSQMEREKSLSLALNVLPQLVCKDIEHDSFDLDEQEERAEAVISTHVPVVGLAVNDLYDRNNPDFGGWTVVGNSESILFHIKGEKSLMSYTHGRELAEKVSAYTRPIYSACEYEKEIPYPESEARVVFDVTENSDKANILPLSLDFHGLLSCVTKNTNVYEHLGTMFGQNTVVEEDSGDGLPLTSIARINMTAPQKTGVAILSVKYRGEHLLGSPLPMHVSYSRVCLPSCKVVSTSKGNIVWNAKTKSIIQAVAGETISVILYLLDAESNPIAAETYAQRVHASLLAQVDCSFRKQASCRCLASSYEINVEVGLAGPGSLCIEIDGVEGNISIPISIKASNVKPAMCIARGNGFLPSPLQ